MWTLRHLVYSIIVLTLSYPLGEAQASRSVPPDRIEAYPQNIRAGFLATTGFELVAATRVPNPNEKGTKEYWREITYPLYLHPSTTLHRIHESAFNAIQWARVR